MKKTRVTLMALALLPLLWVSCEKDKSDEAQKKGSIALWQSIANPDGHSGVDYIQLVDQYPCDKVSTKDGLQSNFLITPMFYRNWVFICPPFGKTESYAIRRLDYSNGALVEGPSLPVPPMSVPLTIEVLSEEKAYAALWTFGKILVFNPTTMQQISLIPIETEVFGPGDQSADPGAMHVRDGLLYVGLNQVSMKMVPQKTIAQIAIIDTKTDQVLKVISDESNGFAFCAPPAVDGNAFFEAENGDLYVSCVGSKGIDPNMKTGFLRIKKGATDFDPSYAFCLNEAVVPGYEHKLDFMLTSIDTNGSEKLAYIWIPDFNTNGPQGTMNDMAADLFLINLPNKTIRHIEGAKPSRFHASGFAKTKDGNFLVATHNSEAMGFLLYKAGSGVIENKPVIPTEAMPTQIHVF